MQQFETPAGDASNQDTPAKRGRPKGSGLSKAQTTIKAYIPIKVDPECRQFQLETPENLLLDKIIHREIYLID